MKSLNEYYKNPFNYIGAKYKLLSQILPLFPNNITTFVDMFGGSAEVSLNVKADKIIYNDKCKQLVNILSNLDSSFVKEVEDTITKFNLGKMNKEEFLVCRKYYNDNKDKLNGREQAVILYCLLLHSFNNQIAFNSKGEFNTPSGYNRSYFTPQLKDRLEKYIERIGKINIDFYSEDFHNLNLGQSNEAFFYADPPYLITVGAYERDYFCKWSDDYERELLNTLDILNEKGCKFALSNVLTHKGKTNEILSEWAKKYNIHHLNMSYKSCNYQTHLRDNKISDEVLITNY